MNHKNIDQVAEWIDDRETFPRMKVHTGSNPVLVPNCSEVTAHTLHAYVSVGLFGSSKDCFLVRLRNWLDHIKITGLHICLGVDMQSQAVLHRLTK